MAAARRGGEVGDEGGHFGLVGVLLEQVGEIAQQMGEAELQRHAQGVIDDVAVHVERAGERGVPADFQGHALAAGGAQGEDAHPRRGEEPGVGVGPVIAPGGLVGVAHGRGAEVGDQVVVDAGELPGDALAGGHERAAGQLQAAGHLPEGEAFGVGLAQGGGQQAVAEGMARQHAGGGRGDHRVAVPAAAAGQLVSAVDAAGGDEVVHPPRHRVVGHQRTVAVRTGERRRDGFRRQNLDGRRRRLAPVADVARLGPALARLPLRQAVLLERRLAGGGAGAKGPFGELPLALAQLRLQPRDLGLQVINPPLLLEAAAAPVEVAQAHVRGPRRRPWR
jgi:hypothetical protein